MRRCTAHWNIFESHRDALVQLFYCTDCSCSLAIRSGNGLLLKGEKEAMRSNTILPKILSKLLSGAFFVTIFYTRKICGLIRRRPRPCGLPFLRLGLHLLTNTTEF